MGLWDGLLTKADADRSSMSAAATRRMWASGPIVRTSGVPYRTGWDLERAITEGLLRSVWTFKAVDTIAKSLCRLPIIFPKGEYRSDEIIDPSAMPVLHRRFNFKANPHEYAIGFRYRLVTQLLMSRKGVFIEYERGRNGDIEWMFLLNPDKVAPIPHERRFVDGYEIDNDGQPDRLDADRVLWIKIPHPTDPYASLTPLEAAGLSIDLDYYGRLYNRNFMANDGRPGGILSMKGPVPDADIEILRRRFSSPRPGEISVVESDGMSFADLSTTPRDASYTNLATQVKNEILVAFGVAESVIGNASGRTYDNADAEENVFWRVTNDPIKDFIDMALSSLTPGGDNDDLWVRHDTSGVQALQRPIKENEQRVIEQFREGTATLNDVLRAMKKDAIDRPGADTYWLPAGKIAIAKDDTELAALAELKAIGSGEAEPEQPALPPGSPNRIGSMLAARLGRGAPQPIDTVRSPEAVGAQRAIEAESTAARRDLERKGDAPQHYCIMIPVPEPEARHIWKASPVPVSKSPHVTVGLFDARTDGEALAVAMEWAQSSEPIKLVIGPDSWTWNNPDGRPFVVGVHSDSLHDARDRMERIVEAHGLSMYGYGQGDYKPHMTLTYLTPEAPDGLQLDPPNYSAFTATKAVLSNPGGDSTKVDLILGG